MSDLLDTNMLDELREIMEDDFPMLLQTFLTESEKQFQSAKIAWQEQQMDDLRRHVHSLKGSCGNIGAQQLRETCETLEYKAKDHEVAEIPELLELVHQQLGEVCTAVARIS